MAGLIRKFRPATSLTTQVITLRKDPAEVSVTAASGYADTKTITFVPAELRNDRYEIKEILIEAACKAPATDADDDFQLSVNTVTEAKHKYGGIAATYHTLAWEVDVKDYGSTLTIIIQIASNNAATYVKDLVVQARVIKRI